MSAQLLVMRNQSNLNTSSIGGRFEYTYSRIRIVPSGISQERRKDCHLQWRSVEQGTDYEQ